MEFDIDLKNLPQSARLCLLLHGVWANPLKVPLSLSLSLSLSYFRHPIGFCLKPFLSLLNGEGQEEE